MRRERRHEPLCAAPRLVEREVSLWEAPAVRGTNGRRLMLVSSRSPSLPIDPLILLVHYTRYMVRGTLTPRGVITDTLARLVPCRGQYLYNTYYYDLVRLILRPRYSRARPVDCFCHPIYAPEGCQRGAHQCIRRDSVYDLAPIGIGQTSVHPFTNLCSKIWFIYGFGASLAA